MKQTLLLTTNMSIITTVELQKILEDSLIAKSGKAKIAKVNSEFLLRALRDGEFKKTLNEFDLKIADGSGVLWAAKYLSLPLVKLPIIKVIQAVWQMVYSGASLIFYPKYCKEPISERFPGIEALKLMLEIAQSSKSSVYFLGAEEEINKKATEVLKKEFPELIIAGRHHGYWNDNPAIIADINKSGAGLLIVALGSPKQEYWIRDNMPKLETVKIVVGEGGSLNRIAGEFRLAPRWMRNVGIEWLWRIFSDKSKSGTGSRGKRVWNAVPIFIYEVVKFKVKNG